MHEAAIVRELIRVAETHVPPGGRALVVEVRVGRLTGVSPDAMGFYFEVLREGTRCAGARLEARLEPLRGRCPACAARFMLDDEAVWLCPRCGAAPVAFENGDELDLLRLEVEDAGSDHDRAEDPAQERRPGAGEP
jgi:hydrogenase nickel incorporation protein HypA/HybF